MKIEIPAKHGVGKLVRRKFFANVEDLLFANNGRNVVGVVTHPQFLERDNEYRLGAALSDGLERVEGHMEKLLPALPSATCFYKIRLSKPF